MGHWYQIPFSHTRTTTHLSDPIIHRHRMDRIPYHRHYSALLDRGLVGLDIAYRMAGF